MHDDESSNYNVIIRWRIMKYLFIVVENDAALSPFFFQLFVQKMLMLDIFFKIKKKSFII